MLFGLKFWVKSHLNLLLLTGGKLLLTLLKTLPLASYQFWERNQPFTSSKEVFGAKSKFACNIYLANTVKNV